MVPLADLPAAMRFSAAFDAVVETVAHQVRERIGDLFDQSLVQFGTLAHASSVRPACRACSPDRAPRAENG